MEGSAGSMTEWQILHTYNNLAAEGKAKPLTCPDDGMKLVPKIGYDDLPVLYCFVCDGVIHPGKDFWDQLTNVVKEHYDI
jgi:hypothetical protein